MATYYLRMEGVNLGAVFSDTNNISVIRGASFLLREAAQSLVKNFSMLKEISVGASVGLFSFEANDKEAAKQLQQEVANHLSQDKKYQFFNFVVNVQCQSNDFNADKEKLIAQNRFQQMQQLSLVMPPEVKDKSICDLTNLLPATTTATYQGENQPVAKSVKVRLEHGRDRKQDFYDQETKVETDFKFTNDLTDLAERDDDVSVANLAGKIAVLYLDGNSFSKLQAKHCQKPEDLTRFDDTIQGKRRKFLTHLLTEFKKDKTCFNYDKMRLETLLWGGDEILFVVPAWKGLHLLQLFYEFSKTWQFENETLTHAGGLVFCRHSTPIRRVRNFAEELADVAKAHSRDNNFFDYMVLESIGYPAKKPDELRKHIFNVPPNFEKNTLLDTYKPLSPFSAAQLETLNELTSKLAKSQAYTIVRAITQDNRTAPETTATFEKKRERLNTVLDDQDFKQALDEKLKSAFPDQTQQWQWLHLVELWDYII